MSKSQKGVHIQDAPPTTQTDPDVQAQNSLKRIKNKFVVLSGKGGVGKTSVSVNISIALAGMGYRVGIMDVDIHGPDIPRMLGIKGILDIGKNKKLIPKQFSKNLSAVSIESLIVDKDDAIIWRGPLKHSAIRQFIGDVEWGELDYLIVDSPPGTGDEPLTVAQLINDARAIIVTTPQEVSLADVRKSINFCKTVNMEIFGLIENMSSFACPHCGKAIDLFGSGGGKKTADAAGIQFLGHIPFDPKVVSCGDAGTSYQGKYKDSAVTKAFADIAERMSKEPVKTDHIKIKQKGKNIKFVLPLAEGRLTTHFGHCKEFAIIDVEDRKIKNKEVVLPPPHEPGVLPKWLNELGANVIISGGMGQKAQSLFAKYGITVIVGAPAEDPEILVKSYLEGSLVSGENLCDH